MHSIARFKSQIIEAGLTPLKKLTSPCHGTDEILIAFHDRHFGHVRVLLQLTNGHLKSLGSQDQDIKIWDLEDDSLIRSIPSRHFCLINSLRVASSESILVSSNEDSTFKIWTL